MVRRLKTYRTSLGFFDLAIAAPSMKAAAEAWGSNTNLFHQGLASQTDDPAIVRATMASRFEAASGIEWCLQRTCRAAEAPTNRPGQEEASKASTWDKRSACSR